MQILFSRDPGSHRQPCKRLSPSPNRQFHYRAKKRKNLKKVQEAWGSSSCPRKALKPTRTRTGEIPANSVRFFFKHLRRALGQRWPAHVVLILLFLNAFGSLTWIIAQKHAPMSRSIGRSYGIRFQRHRLRSGRSSQLLLTITQRTG